MSIIAFLVILSVFVLLGIFTVPQQTVKIVTRFGKFSRIAQTGLNVRIPFIEHVSSPFPLYQQEHKIKVETKTKDNVFVSVQLAVQYSVSTSRVFDAYYRLEDPQGQILSYVQDGIRALVPTYDLDRLFEDKNDIATSLFASLKDAMQEFGYVINRVLVVDIGVEESVARAMNEINASQRELEASKNKAEAEKIILVKQAEAEAESKALQGKGIADQRSAIVKGLETSVKDTAQALGVSVEEVTNMVLLTQYFDTMQHVANTGKATTIMIPSNPGGMASFADEIRNAVIVASKVK